RFATRYEQLPPESLQTDGLPAAPAALVFSTSRKPLTLSQERTDRATVQACSEPSSSESTIRATENAAVIPTAGAGERRWDGWSSGGSPAATSAFTTRVAAR